MKKSQGREAQCLTKQGVKRLEAVIARITAKPKSLNMNLFYGREKCPAGMLLQEDGWRSSHNGVLCRKAGEVACWSSAAALLLGFSLPCPEVRELFYVGCWPKRERDFYNRTSFMPVSAERTRLQAELVIKRIRNFITKYAPW